MPSQSSPVKSWGNERNIERASSAHSMYRYQRRLSDQYKNVKPTLQTQPTRRSRTSSQEKAKPIIETDTLQSTSSSNSVSVNDTSSHEDISKRNMLENFISSNENNSSIQSPISSPFMKQRPKTSKFFSHGEVHNYSPTRYKPAKEIHNYMNGASSPNYACNSSTNSFTPSNSIEKFPDGSHYSSSQRDGHLPHQHPVKSPTTPNRIQRTSQKSSPMGTFHLNSPPTSQSTVSIEPREKSVKARSSMEIFVNDTIESDLLQISKNLASIKKRETKAKMLVAEKVSQVETNHEELSQVLEDIIQDLSSPMALDKKKRISPTLNLSPSSQNDSHAQKEGTQSNDTQSHGIPQRKFSVSSGPDSPFGPSHHQSSFDSFIDKPVTESRFRSKGHQSPVSVVRMESSGSLSPCSPAKKQDGNSNLFHTPAKSEGESYPESLKGELYRIAKLSTNGSLSSPPSTPNSLFQEEVEPVKVIAWWRLLAKAIADAKPKDNSIVVQKLMKIAIKKKEKEVVKAQQRSERSLSALYKNKDLFTRRQTTAILRNINKDRFSDEVVQTPTAQLMSYEKKADPAILLKTLMSKRRQLNTGNANKIEHPERPRSVSRLHIKEFVPYTPEKKKIVREDSFSFEYSPSRILFSDLNSPQSTPQQANSSTHSILTKTGSFRRPRSAVPKSRYRGPSSNPASIVLEFQKMAFRNDPVKPISVSPKKKQRPRIDNGVISSKKKEKKISIGILPSASKIDSK